MVIIGQDKETVVNFDRINYIQVSKVDEKGKSVIEINYADMNWKVIAEYKTEERAKEVLQEIIEAYLECNAESYSTGVGYVKNKVFARQEVQGWDCWGNEVEDKNE